MQNEDIGLEAVLEKYGEVRFVGTKKNRTVYNPALWDILTRVNKRRRRQKKYLKRILGSS